MVKEREGVIYQTVNEKERRDFSDAGREIKML